MECILENSDRTQDITTTGGRSGRKTKRTIKPTKQENENDDMYEEVDKTQLKVVRNKVRKSKNERIASPDEKVLRVTKHGRKKGLTSNMIEGEAIVDLNAQLGKPNQNENEKVDHDLKHTSKRKRPAKASVKEEDSSAVLAKKGRVKNDKVKKSQGDDESDTIEKKMKVKVKSDKVKKSPRDDKSDNKEKKVKVKVKSDKVKKSQRDDKSDNKEKKVKVKVKSDKESDSKEKKVKVKGTDVAGKIVESRKSIKKDMTKFVGAHVSISGGLFKAVDEAVAMGANAFGMFLKSQRQWASKPLTDTDATKFKEACQMNGFPPHLILPHGSYLMNCGSPKEETLQKSRNALVDELQRCEKLGLTLFNFHPGSTCGEISVEESLGRIAESINMAHSKTKYVIAVLENMCCQGNTVGGKFEELREIINQVKDKSRIGVCLDTCHAFAAGHNLSTEDGVDAMLTEFDDVVGLQYLKALHLNDSKGKVGCHLDRHENIGKGHIGKLGFQKLMNDTRLDNIPMILETPCPQDNTYALEVKMLYSMCKT